MSGFNRRTFLQQLGSASLLPAIGAPLARAAGQATAVPQTTTQTRATYDLLVQGGRVIDPASKLSAVRDVAIAGGRIARIAESIPPAEARQVYNAAGKLVTPGLIDMHTHVYRYAINLAVDSDI